MIIQTGMRTDIPAFYSEWFLNRIKEGYVMVRNPYNPIAVTRYDLSPDVVDLIAFCTKNPAPMLKYMEQLKVYRQFWHVTITPYGKDIEPNVPDKEKVMDDFRELSKIVGVDCIAWRYDPIFLNETYTMERHLADFETMAAHLAGYTKTCIISFIDLYKKVQRNFPEAQMVSRKNRIELGEAFVKIGKQYDISIKSCAEGRELAPYGVDCSGCMMKEVFENAIGAALSVPKRKSARAECDCILGNDIGAYNTCGHLCRYCYANYDAATVQQNMRHHHPASPLLLGVLRPEDEIHQAKQESWVDRQLRLELW